jgi:hypothetical protein
MQIDSPVSPSDKQYFLSRPLWQKLDNDSRAGLVLHEVIYTDALRFGQKNSINVRKINSHLASGVAFQMSDRDFYELFARAGFGSSEVRGLSIEEWTRVGYTATVFYADGSLKSAAVADDSSFSLSQAGTKVAVRIRGDVQFYDEGAIKSLLLSQPARLRSTHGTRLFSAGTYLELSKSGLVTAHH